jgi:hypothetical protein
MSQMMSMATTCSFMGGVGGGAAYLYWQNRLNLSGQTMLMLLVAGGVGYGVRMVNDRFLGTPGSSSGPLPNDNLSCTLIGAASGALGIYGVGKLRMGQ